MERTDQENTFFKKINLGSLRPKQLLKDPLLAPSFPPSILKDNSFEFRIFRSLQKALLRPRGQRCTSKLFRPVYPRPKQFPIPVSRLRQEAGRELRQRCQHQSQQDQQNAPVSASQPDEYDNPKYDNFR